MESMQLALENIVNSIFDGSNEFGGGSSEVQLALCRIFEGFFLANFFHPIRVFSFWLYILDSLNHFGCLT